MSKLPTPRPTDAELAILRILWREGPCTVRQVMEHLNRSRPTGYTTVLKFLQIMTQKKLVQRDESQRKHVYIARYSEERTQQQLVFDLLERAFGGSRTKLVMQALAGQRATPEELAEVRKLLDELEEKAP